MWTLYLCLAFISIISCTESLSNRFNARQGLPLTLLTNRISLTQQRRSFKPQEILRRYFGFAKSFRPEIPHHSMALSSETKVKSHDDHVSGMQDDGRLLALGKEERLSFEGKFHYGVHADFEPITRDTIWFIELQDSGLVDKGRWTDRLLIISEEILWQNVVTKSHFAVSAKTNTIQIRFRSDGLSTPYSSRRIDGDGIQWIVLDARANLIYFTSERPFKRIRKADRKQIEFTQL